MNGEKMKVVIGSWLALALISGANLHAEEKPVDHGPAGTKPAESGTARPKAANVPLPGEYEQLKAALEKVDSRGLTVKEAVDLAEAKKDVTVAIGDVVKMRNWLEGNFKKYREFLTSCAVSGDKSADITGKLLDGFITKLAEAITDDPKNAAGLKEKHLITFVTQMERVLKEKAALFASGKADFEKADEKLLDQMKKTVGFLFGGYHGEQFDHLKQSADAWAKPIVAESTAAIEALVAREGASGKVCKLGEDKPAAETTAEAKPDGAKPPTTATADAGKKPKLDPGPIEGGNAESNDNGTAGGDKGPGTVAGGDTTLPIDTGTNDVPFVDTGNNQTVNDFDADALLRGVLDRFGQLEDQAKLDQDRAKQDLQNAVDSARRLGDDIARQQQQAIDANNNNDNGLADALGKLATQQQQPPPPPPAPPAPPPTIIPPQDNGQQAQQPFIPPQQQDDFGGQQQPQQQQPFFPPPQQSQAPIIIGGQDDSKYLQDDYYRRNAVQPVANPQQGGMLELLRLQQQLMFAQQQSQYGGQVGQNGVRMNVNTMANRLSGGAAMGSSSVRRAIPGKTATGVATQTASAGRSTTVPAAIRGAK